MINDFFWKKPVWMCWSGSSSSGSSGSDDSGGSDDYTIQSGDTLSEIAEANDMSVAEIMADNPGITNADQIQAGASLDLSGAGSGSSTYAGGVGLGGVGSGSDDNDPPPPVVYYDMFGNAHTTTAARNNADVQYGRQESWNNPSNWIITSNERGDLDKQYIGNEPAPSGGNYTVPSFAAIDSGTSKPGSSLDVVVEGSQAYVTDKAGQKFTNVDSAVSSDASIDRKVSSYEDPSNYRIDTNQQDDLVRIYVGNESAPPISYNTPSWEAVDTAQESASDKDQYYDLTFVDGQRKVLDSYGNAFDTPAEATSNDVKIVDHLKPDSYEVIEAGGIANAIYKGEYGTPDVQLGSGYMFETPSVTEVLNATTYKDKPYRVEYDPEENVTSAFVGDQRLAGQYGTELNDELVMSYKTAYDAGYEIDTPEIEDQVTALMTKGEMFLDEDMDGVPDTFEERAEFGFAPTGDAAAGLEEPEVSYGGWTAEGAEQEAQKYATIYEGIGEGAEDTVKGFGRGAVNSFLSMVESVAIADFSLTQAQVEKGYRDIDAAGVRLEETRQDFVDALAAKGYEPADLTGMNITSNRELASLLGTDGAYKAGLYFAAQQGVKRAYEDSLQAIEDAGVPLNEYVLSAWAQGARDSADDFIGEYNDPTGKAAMYGEGLGSAASYIAVALPATAMGAPIIAAGTAAVMGSAMNSTAMYKDAIKNGATQEEAATSYVLGGFLGATEAAPVARILNALPPQVRNKILNVALDGGVEAAQEAFTAFGNNVIAKGIYDPERGLTEGVSEAAIMGLFVGSTIGTGVTVGSAALQDAGLTKAEADTIIATDGSVSKGMISREQVQTLLDQGYTVDQIAENFSGISTTNTVEGDFIGPAQMTIEGLAANSAFQDTAIKTGAGDPAIMYGNPANNMFSATAPSPDALPVYLDVKNPFTIESIGTPKGKETLTEVLGSSRADALISEFRQNGNVTLTGADVQKVAESGYDGVIDNDSGKVYVADNSSVYSVTDPETTTEETVVATKPEWKTQLDEAFYLTGSIDMDLAKQVEQEFGVSPFEINEHYQEITASDAAWEKRLLGDYLTKGYIDLDTMLKAEADFGVSMQDLGNYAEYLDSDLSVYNDAMFADQIKEVQDLTASQTSLQSEVTSLTNELSAVEADLIEMTSNRDLDSEAAATAIAKQEQLSGELSAKKEELAGVEKTLGETQTALEAETGARATAEQTVTTLTSDLDSANTTITDLQSSLDAANDKVSTLNTTIEGLSVEVETGEAAIEAAAKVVTKLNDDIQFKNEEITGLEADVKAAEDAVLAKQGELDTASASVETSAETITSLNSEIAALMSSASALDGDLSTAIGERDSLQGTLDERTTERDSLQESLTSSNTQLETANKQLTAANTQVTDLTSQKEVLTKEVATLTTELGTANTNLTAALEASGSSATLAENLNTQLQTANSTISSMTTELNETMADVTALEKEIASQKENQTISDADLDAAEASLKAANLEVQTLADALGIEEAAKNELQKKLTSAESDLSKLQESSSKSIESLGLEVDTANVTIENLQGQLTTATNNVSTLSSQLEAAQTSQTATAEQKAALATQLEAAQTEATSLLSDITKLEGQRDTLQADLTAAEATVGTQDTTITDLTDRLSTANTNIGTLQEQLTTATNNVSTLSSQLEAAQTSQTATAEQKAALAEQLEAAQTEATSLLSDITALEGQRDTLQADLTAAQSTIGTQETTIGNQAEAITTLTTDLSTANQDIGSLNQQLGTANESVAALEGQLEAANNSLTATQTEKDTIAANLDTARENARALTESLSARTKERDNLQVSLNDTKTTLSNTVTLANTLQTNLDASNAEITTLETQLDTAQANVESLTNTLTDATALQELTEGEKLDLQNDLIASQNDVAALTDTLDSRTTERDGIQTQLTETQAELTASTTLTETLQGNLDTAQANIAGLETQLGDSQTLQQLTEEQRAALEQTLAEEQANAASLETQLGEVTSAFDITQTQLDFAQGVTNYVNTQLDQNVAEDALVADLVTRGYSAANAQTVVNEVQQTRFEQSELARITDARRSAAYVPFGAGPVGGEEDEVTYPDYGPPGTGTAQPQAQQPYQPPATAYQPPLTQPVYQAPQFAPFTRDDATPIAGGPAVELDQFGQPILSFGSTGRPLGSYVTMPTQAGPFDPYLMEMPEAPTFNPQQPVVRPPFPQQPQPVINQGIGGLGRK